MLNHELEVPAHFTEVLVLELEHVNALKGHVEASFLRLRRHHVRLLIRLLLKLAILLKPFFYHRIDVEVSPASPAYHISLGLHDLLGTVQNDLLVLVLAQCH